MRPEGRLRDPEEITKEEKTRPLLNYFRFLLLKNRNLKMKWPISEEKIWFEDRLGQ